MLLAAIARKFGGRLLATIAIVAPLGVWSASGLAQDGSSQPETEPVTAGSATQGRYRLELGAGRPTFTGDTKSYRELYGHPHPFIQFNIERALTSRYATLGLGGRAGLYKESGFAADVADDSVVQDGASETELTLVPLQGVLVARLTPFAGRWLLVNAWAGPEWLYVQEVRAPVQGGAATTGGGDSVYVNKGFNRGLVTGASISIRLDPLDESAVSSLSILGYRSIYITPFYEIITSTRNVGQFSRTNTGILFTFESMI